MTTTERGWEFDVEVPQRGYRWWYVDALSEDGAHGITLIAFIGTVFSPWYAWARRGGGGDPHNHCCLNVALYGSPRRWAMTDRRRGAVERGPNHFVLGPSSLEWDGEGLTIRIDERTAPFPGRIKGVVRVRPRAVSSRAFALDAKAKHIWQPIAARSVVEVDLESPGLRWSGPGYFDTNHGSAPLEEDFVEWDWCRSAQQDATAILYNADRRDGSRQALALRVLNDGRVEDIASPPETTMPRTKWWWVSRRTRSEDGRASVIRTWEDTPFYSRSEIRTRLLGREAPAVHESLNLDRFASLAVQALLPVKVPRPLR